MFSQKSKWLDWRTWVLFLAAVVAALPAWAVGKWAAFSGTGVASASPALQQLSELRYLLVSGGYPNSSGCGVGQNQSFILDFGASTVAKTGNLNIARNEPISLSMKDGRVTVFLNDSGCSSSQNDQSEIYSPTTGAWTLSSKTAGLFYGRPEWTQLADGRWLIAGGETTKVANLFDPATGTFSSTAGLATPRHVAATEPLPDGGAIIAGGVDGAPSYNILTSTLKFTPTTGQWSNTGALNVARAYPAHAVLNDGRILVAGGMIEFNNKNTATASAEIYDPATGKWTQVGNLNKARYQAKAVTLANGKVLIVGGGTLSSNVNSTNLIAETELFDPATNTFTLDASLNTPRRASFGLTRLPGGNVVVVNGSGAANSSALDSIEIYTPANATSLDSGLVAYYPFDGNANDASGNGRAGALIGSPTFSAGVKNSAIDISLGNFVSVTNRFVPGTGSFSFSAFIKESSAVNYFMAPIITVQGGDFANGAMLLAGSSTATPTLGMSILAGSTSGQNINYSPAKRGGWHHVAAVVDRESGKVTLYEDGVNVKQETISFSGAITPSMDMLIGAYDYITARNGLPRFLSGNISVDEVRIYNRALAPAEVAALYVSVGIPPILSGVALSGIGQTSVTLTASSNQSVNGYWLVVARDAAAPTAAQVKSGQNYAGVKAVASGTGPMTANVAKSFAIKGLAAGTDYDFYVVSQGGDSSLSAPVKVQGTTQSIATAPVVSRFVFDPIADQSALDPIPVSIRATDANGNTLTGFNDMVQLLGYYGSASVSPSSVKFVNGAYQASVKYSGSTGMARLSAQYSKSGGTSASGQSNLFSFLLPSLITEYSVKGTTQPDTNISLQSTKDNSIIGPVIADANGNFEISNVPVGEYSMHATKVGYNQHCPIGQCIIIVSNNLTISPQLRTLGRPVILLPGVMGSTLGQDSIPILNTQNPRNVAERVVGKAPKLPAHKCQIGTTCLLRDKHLKIYDPSMAMAFGQCDGWNCTVMGSHLLIKDLEAAGFVVYATPWDWRHPFSEAAEIYLKPAIEDALMKSGWDKVDVVAHSMGGLVARYYIEKLDGGRNIDRFIMLGTPNLGSNNAYFLMQGGDPITLDATTNSIGANYYAQAAFYTSAANELWRTMNNGADMLTGLTFSGDVQITSKYNISTTDIKKFLAENVKGGDDLLPIYDFLEQLPQSSSNTCGSFGNGEPNPGLNPELKSMNVTLQPNNFESYYAPIGSRPPNGQQVEVRLLYSNSEQTLHGLGYAKKGSEDTTYPYGIPSCVTTAKGDGTVLESHGAGPFPANLVIPADFGSHPEMVGKARNEVVRALVRPGSAKAAASASPAQDVVEPITLAAIDIDGQYSALLTASDGKRSGTVAGAGGIFEEIVASGVSITPYEMHIGQGSPVNGTYLLQLSAESPLVLTAARVSLNYLQPNVGTQSDTLRILIQATPYLANIVQDSAATRWMTFVDPVKPPTALNAVPQSDLTQLSWTAPDDATVTGYHVYYRAQDDVRYQLLGSTSNTNFATTIAWALNYDSSSDFIVLSVNSAGVESPIRSGNTTRNLSYARAAFTAAGINANGVIEATTYPLGVMFADTSEATAAVQSWAWDFDNDGVTDSTEQNPTFSYAIPGSYSVSLTVTTADGSTDSKTLVNFVNIRTVPEAPVVGAASAGDAQASVIVIAPANTGNSAITGYTATSAPGGLTSIGCTASPCSVIGLTNGTAYTFTVTATNGIGTGPASGASNSVTPKGHQTIVPITFNPATLTVGGNTNASATATSGLEVSFGSSTPTICSVTDTKVVTGLLVGTCTIAANQSGSANYAAAAPVTQNISVGANLAPAVLFNPTSLTFSEQVVGTTSTAKNATLTNTGNAPLSISFFETTGDFAVSHNCDASLAASASCNLGITFTPSATAGRVGVAKVSSNATGSPHSVILSGTGVLANAPICRLIAAPAAIPKRGTATLTATCSPAATSFTWTGGNCAGTTLATCTVSPIVTTNYSVTGTNSYGSSTSSEAVKVKSADLSPILMLLLD